MFRSFAIGLVLPFLIFAAALGAQTASPGEWGGSARCVAAIPPGRLKPAPVYVMARVPEGTPKSLVISADLLAESVAERLRERVSGRPDSLPAADSLVSWRGFDDGLKITVKRGQPLAYRVPTAADSIVANWPRAMLPLDMRDDRGMRLLAAALDSVLARGEPFFVWPETPAADSLTFELRLLRTTLDSEGKLVEFSFPAGRPLFLVFSVRSPRESPAYTLRGTPSPGYPASAKERGLGGTFVMQYVIDTTGRANMETVRHVRPPGRALPQGEMARIYAEFLQSIRAALEKSRFQPAAIGGCKVPMLVTQPYEFAIGR